MRDSSWMAITCLAALGACQRSAEPQATPQPRDVTTPSPTRPVISDKREYRCGEIVVSADFQGAGPVLLRFDGKELTLPQVASGSGARYADDQGNVFWSKGDDAMFTLAGQAMRTCISAASPT